MKSEGDTLRFRFVEEIKAISSFARYNYRHLSPFNSLYLPLTPKIITKYAILLRTGIAYSWQIMSFS